MKIKNTKTLIWDVGGSQRMRTLWHKYFKDAHGLIFVIDSSDIERFEENAQVLYDTLSNEEVNGLPLLIFTNKQDLPSSLNSDKVLESLNVSKASPFMKDRMYKVQACSGLTCEGLKDGISWIVEVGY